MTKRRICTTSVASGHPHYVAKAEKKGWARNEVDEIIGWLTGYRQDELAKGKAMEKILRTGATP